MATTSPAQSVQQQHGQQRRRITRSRDGCLTCRSRRKKCPLRTLNSQQKCDACERLLFDCIWPEIKPYTPRSNKRSSPFLSKNQGRSPSVSTVQSPSSPSDIASIDAHIENNNTNNEVIPDQLFESFSFTPTSILAQEFTSIDNNNDSSNDNSNNPNTTNGNSLLNNLASTPSTVTEEIMSQTSQQDHGQRQIDFLESSNILDFANVASILALPMPLAPPSVNVNLSDSVQSQLVKYFQKRLSPLVSCTGSGIQSPGYAIFSSLAALSSSDTDIAGTLLSIAIKSWGARHLANGDPKFERPSEILSQQALRLVAHHASTSENILLPQTSNPSVDVNQAIDVNNNNHILSDPLIKRQLTIASGILLLIHFKICRGDVSGVSSLAQQVGFYISPIYDHFRSMTPGSALYHFFENILYHEVLSTSSFKGSCIFEDPSSIVSSALDQDPSYVSTLSGLSIKVLCIIGKVNKMIRKRRQLSEMHNGGIPDNNLLELHSETMAIENDLQVEKSRLDSLINANPSLSVHRSLHELFCVACILHLRSGVLCESPWSIASRLLVQQGINLLETIAEKNVAGYCSIHWPLFIIAVSASDSGENQSARSKVMSIYNNFIDSLQFWNVSRSRRLIQHVWSMNDRGKQYVDWIDVVESWDWELWMA